MPANADLARLGRIGLAGCAIVACASGLVQASAPVVPLLDAAVGATFTIAGLSVWRRRRAERVGTLMIATALGWGLGGVLHRGPLAHLLLTYPLGKTTRWNRPLILLGYVDAVLGSLAFVNIATLLFSAGLALVAGGQALAAKPAIRRRTIPAVVAAFSIALVLAPGLGLQVNDQRATDPVLVIYELVLIATGIGLAAWLSLRGSSVVTGVVTELGVPGETPLRERLAHALGDPSLVIGYAVGDPTRFVDEIGREVEVGGGQGRVVTYIQDDGQPLAVLVHDPAVLDDPRTLNDVTAVTRIAVENLRLREEIEGRTQALKDSQRRLIQAVDTERRQIERQLEARVLNRLDHVRESLGGAAADHAAPTIDAEAGPLLNAIELDLHAIALGLFPARLEEHGLPGALDDLVQAASIPVQLSVGVGRLPAPVEATAYYVCAEALTNVEKHAHASRVTIDIGTAEEGALHVVVSDDGIGGADASGSGLDGLRARVGGQGGSLDIISSPGHGTRIEARLPVSRATAGLG